MKPILTLDPQGESSLVQQIVAGLTATVNERTWRSGAKVPSIRVFAEAHGVSTFTVVEAYDRLVAQGVLMARRGSGFYVADRNRSEIPPTIEKLNEEFTNGWSLRNVLEGTEGTIHAGSGWIPEAWFDADGLGRALRQVAAQPRSLLGYGHAKGYEPLREQIVRQLAEHEIEASSTGIVTTLGANQALDLAIRHLTREGDTVLVDEPCYSDLLVALRLRRIKAVGIPMTPTGPDVVSMEHAFETHRPKVFFTNTRLHNPTGASYSSASAFKVLKLAERYDCIIVEDDVSAGLVSGNSVALASMDQLKRVVYVGSFSKTIGAGLRVGFVAAEPALLEGLLYQKLVSGMSTPTITEQLAHAVLSEGHFRKQAEQLRDRLATAQERTCRRLESIGFEVFCEPRSGMFVWARPAGINCDSAELAVRAVDHKILLAPGNLFYATNPTSSWLRFNVAHCNFDRLYAFLAHAIAH
ncbi:PLP-dependent aminotransferase family protein [Burkholderia cepacia]|uniref:aminotransferase-like domain-containing protein n=1 Tax=Burkholderia cepacia TaxID=292 RepID=UPI00158EB5F1|nr:PLP-dependent aminotransferase family protein [Burkholderia cepacia]